MAYLYLIIVTVLFSFGGMLIKVSGTMFSPYMVSFLRFAIGVVLLLIIQKKKTGKVAIKFTGGFLWFGAICKALHYLGENYGVMQGFSYGNVVIWPIQTLTVLIVSVLIFKERITKRSLMGTFFCLLGIGMISWNGVSLETFLGSQMFLLLSFVIAGIGAALFSVCQKELLQSVDTVEMNLSMFLLGSGICGLILPGQENLVMGFHVSAIVAMLILGVITGVGFLLLAEAMKEIPLFLITVVQSSTVILTVLWGVLFFKEPITPYIIMGISIFIAGILLINVKRKK